MYMMQLRHTEKTAKLNGNPWLPESVEFSY